MTFFGTLFGLVLLGCIFKAFKAGHDKMAEGSIVKYYTKSEAHEYCERMNKAFTHPTYIYIPVLVRDVRWSILKERIA